MDNPFRQLRKEPMLHLKMQTSLEKILKPLLSTVKADSLSITFSRTGHPETSNSQGIGNRGYHRADILDEETEWLREYGDYWIPFIVYLMGHVRRLEKLIEVIKNND
jgi:hypothetical protein